LKYGKGGILSVCRRRTPHGVRGLKYYYKISEFSPRRSHPARGAWIEMPFLQLRRGDTDVAPRTGCVD